MSINKKAQVMTYDFFLATAIFLAVLAIILGYWFHSVSQIQEVEEKNIVAEELFSASDIWFKEGYPKYWGIQNIRELGLSNDLKINQTKLNLFFQLGYPKIVSLLNLGTDNIQYTLYNSSNAIIFQYPSGVDISSAKNVYQNERFGILNDSIVKIRTIIWD
jgi:hypothetical protein